MMKIVKSFLKDLFFLTKGEPIGNRASILSYHYIGSDEAFFTVRAPMFEKQLEYIATSGYSVVFLSDLLKTLRAQGDVSRMVALTFNDGYESAYSEVFPLLKKYKMSASIFTTVEYLDTNIQTSDGFIFKTLSQSAIREMITSGLVEFFPQTQHRQALDTVAFEQAALRIEQVRKDLESVIKKDARVFSYPKGRSTQKIVDYLEAQNWLGAVTVKEGLIHKDTNPFLLPRNSIDSRTSFVQFKGKLSGAIDAYVSMRTE